MARAIDEISKRGEMLKLLRSIIKEIEREKDEAQEVSRKDEYTCIYIKLKLKEQMRACNDFI